MLTPSTTQLLEATLPDLLTAEAGAGVSGQPTSLSQLPPDYSLSRQEAHVGARLDTLEALAGLPAASLLGPGVSEEEALRRLRVRLAALLEMGVPAPAGVVRLLRPSYLSATLREKASKKVVRTLLNAELRPAGTYPLTADRYDEDGVALPNGFDFYEVDALSHEQDFSVDATWAGVVGNTSGGVGPNAWGGISLVDDMILAGDWLVAVLGYAEGSLNLVRALRSNPNFIYPIHEASTLSGTNLARDPATGDIFVAGLFVFGGTIGDGNGPHYSGRAVIRIGSDFADKPFSEGTTIVTHSRTYNCIDLRQNGAQIDDITVSGQYLLVCHRDANEVSVYDKDSGAYVSTNTIPDAFTIAAAGNVVFVGHSTNVVEKYFLEGAGILSSVGATLTGFAQVGKLAMTDDGSKLGLTDVGETAVEFFGNYAPNNNEVLKANTLYYRGTRTFRYTGPAGATLTTAQWDALPDAGTAQFVPQRSTLLSTATHRVRFYSAESGALLESFGQGDYATDPTAAVDKFMFWDTKYFRDSGDQCFLNFGSDNGFVVGNRGCFQTLFFGPYKQYLNQIQFTSTYSISVNANQPSEQVIDYNFFSRNVEIPLGQPGAYGYVANYSTAWQPGRDNVFKRFYCLSTWPTGGTYAFQQDVPSYRWYIVQKMATGVVSHEIYSKDLASFLTPDGDLYDFEGYEVGGPSLWTKHPLTGVQRQPDGSDKPIYGPAVQGCRLTAAQLSDPLIANMSAPPTPQGLFLGYDIGVGQDGARSGEGGYHLTAIDPATGEPRWRALPSTRKNYAGQTPPHYFDTGNLVQRGGSFLSSVGTIAASMYIGEFRKNGQAEWAMLHDTVGGHFLGRLGKERDDTFVNPPRQPGDGGNGLTGLLWQSGQHLRFSVGNEGGFGPTGIHEYNVDKLLTTIVRHPAIALTAWTPKVAAPGIDLNAGLPYDATIQASQAAGRWTFGPDVNGTVSAQTSLYTLDKDWVDLALHFSGTGGNGVGSQARCALPAPTGEAPWSLTGQMGWPSVGADGIYTFLLYEVLDMQDRVIVQMQHHDDGNSQYRLRFNDQTVNAGLASTQVRTTFYPRDVTISATSAGLSIAYAGFPVLTGVQPMDANAQILQRATIRVSFKNFANGGGELVLRQRLLTTGANSISATVNPTV